MRTLTTAIDTKFKIQDQNKILIAHLYYSDTEFFRLASKACVIDGYQYLDVLKDFINVSLDWNAITNVISTPNPTLQLIDYQTIDGYNLSEQLMSDRIVGWKAKIYITYENLTISDSYLIFDGYTDNFEFNPGIISIEMIGDSIPDNVLNNSVITKEKQKIGEQNIDTTYELLNDGERLPYILGKHWNAPCQAWGRLKTTGDIYFGGYYKPYPTINAFVVDEFISPTKSLVNIGIDDQVCYLNDGDYLVPFHQKGYPSGSDLESWTIDQSQIPMGIKKIVNSSSFNNLLDGNSWLNVPLRMFPYETYSYATIPDVNLGIGNFPISLFEMDFSQITGSFIAAGPTTSSILRVNTLLGAANLKTDESGIYPNRKIGWLDCIPQVMGFYTHYDYNFLLHFFSNNHYQQPISNSALSLTITNDYLGSTTGSKPYSGYIRGNYRNVPLYGYSQSTNPNLDLHAWETLDTNPAVEIGNAQTSSIAGSSSNLPNSLLDTNVTCRLDWSMVGHTDPPNGLYFSASNIYLMSYGQLDSSEVIYSPCNGLKIHSLADGNQQFFSCPNSMSQYQLIRPYEYIELLLRGNGYNSGSHFSNNWQSISSSWDSFWSTKRDGSGFVVKSDLNLDDFLKKYLENEPFVIGKRIDGVWDIRHQQPTYSLADVQMTVNYDDLTDFEYKLTDISRIVSEVTVKTDYNYATDDYNNDYTYRLISGTYDYGFWDSKNTQTDNKYKKNIEKKYTSFVPTDNVLYGGYGWSCALTSYSQPVPYFTMSNWNRFEKPYNTSAFSAYQTDTFYRGQDIEGWEIADWYLNENANRKYLISFMTTKMNYSKLDIGDIIAFKNVPYPLPGLVLSGFNKQSVFSSSLNNQLYYAAFVVTNFSIGLNQVSVKCQQLVDNTIYQIERIV